MIIPYTANILSITRIRRASIDHENEKTFAFSIPPKVNLNRNHIDKKQGGYTFVFAEPLLLNENTKRVEIIELTEETLSGDDDIIEADTPETVKESNEGYIFKEFENVNKSLDSMPHADADTNIDQGNTENGDLNDDNIKSYDELPVSNTPPIEIDPKLTKELDSVGKSCKNCWIFKKQCSSNCIVTDQNDSVTDATKQKCKMCWLFEKTEGCKFCLKCNEDNKDVIQNDTFDDANRNTRKRKINKKSENNGAVKKIKWECKICFTINENDRFKCFCCDSNKYNNDTNFVFGKTSTEFNFSFSYYKNMTAEEPDWQSEPNKDNNDENTENITSDIENIPFIGTELQIGFESNYMPEHAKHNPIEEKVVNETNTAIIYNEMTSNIYMDDTDTTDELNTDLQHINFESQSPKPNEEIMDIDDEEQTNTTALTFVNNTFTNEAYNPFIILSSPACNEPMLDIGFWQAATQHSVFSLPSTDGQSNVIIADKKSFKFNMGLANVEKTGGSNRRFKKPLRRINSHK